MLAIDVVEHVSHLFLRETLAVQCAGKPLALILLIPQHRKNTRMEVPIPVSRYTKSQDPTLAIRMLTAFVSFVLKEFSWDD